MSTSFVLAGLRTQLTPSWLIELLLRKTEKLNGGGEVLYANPNEAGPGDHQPAHWERVPFTCASQLEAPDY